MGWKGSRRKQSSSGIARGAVEIAGLEAHVLPVQPAKMATITEITCHHFVDVWICSLHPASANRFILVESQDVVSRLCQGFNFCPPSWKQISDNSIMCEWQVVVVVAEVPSSDLGAVIISIKVLNKSRFHERIRLSTAERNDLVGRA